MTAPVETLSALERRIQLSVPAGVVQQEVENRLKKLARTVKMSGFRPGKVPLKMVAQNYGPQVENEVLNEQINRILAETIQHNALRVAGFPAIEPVVAEGATDALKFTATFEVYPEVKLGDLASLQITKSVVSVTPVEIDKTLDIMRKQRANYSPVARATQNDDKVKIDFVGRIDGTEFSGGSAQDFEFVVGQKQMLPEFEAGILGASVGDVRSVTVSFPADYHGKDVAGKTAQFEITVKAVQAPDLPALDEEFVKTLGVETGQIDDLRRDIQENLEREISARLSQRNKNAVMDALGSVAELILPKALVEQEALRMAEQMKAEFQQRGGKSDMQIPPEIFKPQAEKSVRLGLIVADLVKRENLQAQPEQIKSRVEEFARSYEQPDQVVAWYYNDMRRLDNVRAVVLEDNVVEFVLARAKVTEQVLSFDEVMEKSA